MLVKEKRVPIQPGHTYLGKTWEGPRDTAFWVHMHSSNQRRVFWGEVDFIPTLIPPPHLIQAKGNFRWKLQSDTSFSPRASEEFYCFSSHLMLRLAEIIMQGIGVEDFTVGYRSSESLATARRSRFLLHLAVNFLLIAGGVLLWIEGFIKP